MTVYVVTRKGVYRHEILGIYTKHEDALDRAKLVAKQEDNYHTFDVSRCELDEAILDVELVEEVRNV